MELPGKLLTKTIRLPLGLKAGSELQAARFGVASLTCVPSVRIVKTWREPVWDLRSKAMILPFGAKTGSRSLKLPVVSWCKPVPSSLML